MAIEQVSRSAKNINEGWGIYNALVTALLTQHDTSGAHKAAADVILKALFDANTILAANTDNTPAALTVPASRIIGRAASGNIAALTAAQIRTLLSVENGATADQTEAEILALLGLTSAEVDQVGNIGANLITASIWEQIANMLATAISAAQWGYLGALAHSPSYITAQTDTSYILIVTDSGDTGWIELDMNTAGSGLVPTTATAVILRVSFEDSAPTDDVRVIFRKKGETESTQQFYCRCYVAGIKASHDLLVGLDAEGKLQYTIKASGADTANLWIRLMGWIEPA